MIKAPPKPEFPKSFPKVWREFFQEVIDICWAHFPFAGNESIEITEDPAGLKTIVPPTRFPEIEVLQPLQIITNGTDHVQIVAGKHNGGYVDPAMDPQEGTTGHSFFFYPKTGDPALVDGDRLYVEVTMSFDGTYWRDVPVGIVAAAATPTPTEIAWYLELNPVTVSVTGIVTTPTPQQWIGNIQHVRRGTEAVWADDVWHV